MSAVLNLPYLFQYWSRYLSLSRMDFRKATHRGSLYVIICFNVFGLHGFQYFDNIVKYLVFNGRLTVAVHLRFPCIPQSREFFYDVVFLDVLHVSPLTDEQKAV